MAKCVPTESILQQTGLSFEVVIVNNGSDAAAGKRLYEFQNGLHIPTLKRRSFRVVTQAAANHFFNAVQYGTKLARGTYVVVVDSSVEDRKSTRLNSSH